MAKHDNIHLKKSLGQHFLNDREVLIQIKSVIDDNTQNLPLLEVGPGAGALSAYLKDKDEYKLVEFDKRWAAYLPEEYPELKGRVILGDFLQMNLKDIFPVKFAVVGNFPYNISSQIIFKVLDFKDDVPVCIGMFQKEVAKRISGTPGGKEYGILSILAQLFYDITYLFDVPKEAFNPPPKVVSGVMMMKRKENDYVVNYSFLKMIVKVAFNQRRKTLRNSLKQFLKNDEVKALEIFDKRPETLSVEAFVNLSNVLETIQ